MASISGMAPARPPVRDLPSRYTKGAAILHWLMAAIILAQIGVGFTFAWMERGPARTDVFLWHKTLGVLILLLAVVRLGWRLTHTPPPYPPELPNWQRVAAVASHWLFYFLLFALPLTGLIAVSGRTETGTTPLLFGLNLPVVPGVTKEAGHTFGEVHVVLVLTTLALFVLHVAAALKHQLFDRNRMTGRMPPLPPLPPAA
jgi:cytochrome b561